MILNALLQQEANVVKGIQMLLVIYQHSWFPHRYPDAKLLQTQYPKYITGRL